MGDAVWDSARLSEAFSPGASACAPVVLYLASSTCQPVSPQGGEQPADCCAVLQDLKSCLARELEVSEEEAGEMASTVVHRSNQVLPTTRLSCRAMYLTNVSLVAAAHYG